MNMQVLFADDLHTSFPATRWSLSHLRELVPSKAIRRGSGPVRALTSPPMDTTEQIDAVEFTDLNGQRCTWNDSLLSTYTDGIIVLHRGMPVFERYFGELLPHRPHACFSITKSYAATVGAMLIYEKVLNERALVPHYLPEMSGTAYADATVRQVLDMQIGVEYSEDYTDPDSPFWHYTRAAGLRPALAGNVGRLNNHDLLLALRKRGEHGLGFDYATVNTEVLCWLMAKATGTALADLLSERIWSKVGCEEDGYLTVDAEGVEMGGAGLSATLRDVARFGEVMRCDGAWSGRQVIPAAVVADIRKGSDPAKFTKAGYALMGGYSYRNMWWVSHNPREVFEGRGIFGQRLYVAPRAEVVIARFSSHPVATSANDPITLPAFDAVCALLAD